MADKYLLGLNEAREAAEKISASYVGDSRFRTRIWYVNPIKSSVDVIIAIKSGTNLDTLIDETKDKQYFLSIGPVEFDTNPDSNYIRYWIPVDPLKDIQASTKRIRH
jgi:hypothetical protein